MEDKTDVFFDSISSKAIEIASHTMAVPICFAMKGPQIYPAPLSWDTNAEKEMKVAALKMIFKKIQPEAIVCVMESYARMVNIDDVPFIPHTGEFMDKVRETYKPKDILMVTLYRKGEVVSRTWDVQETKEGGKVTERRILNPEIHRFKPEKNWSGVMDFSDVFE